MISTAGAGYFGAAQADAFWLMVCGFFVFFMQCGFALLEAGTVRAKNTKNILLKNLLDASVGAVIWWVCGFMIAVRAPPAPRARVPARRAPLAVLELYPPRSHASRP